MQVSVESTTTLGRKLTVSIPSQEVDMAMGKRLNEVAKQARIDGYRQGHVPKHIIKMRFGSGVREEVVKELINTNLQTAVEQESLNCAGIPNLNIIEQEEGKDLQFEAEVELYPEFELADVSEVEIERETAELDDAAIDKRLDAMRKQFVDWKQVEREAKNGDQITIDFEGSIDGEVFQGGSAEGFQLELGSNNMIPGFEEALLGVKTDEDRTISVTFPEDYPAKDLASKAADFKIHVSQVAESVLPELDDSLAERLGITEGGIEKLRQQIRDVMEVELKNLLNNGLKQKVMDKLLEVNAIELPTSLVAQEEQQLQMQALQDLKQRLENMSELAELPDLSADNFKEQAEKRVHLGLVLSKIIEKHEIKLDDARLRKKIEEISALYDDAEHVRSIIFNDKNRLAELETIVMEEQITDKMVEMMQVKDKSMSYDELINRQDVKEKTDDE